MSANQNYGPYWTMNSGEGIAAFTIVGFILASPAIPALMLGYYIGVNYIGNNFAKWGLSGLFFLLMYLFIIYINRTKGFLYAFAIVFLEYLLLDYINMKMQDRDYLVMMRALESFIHWGLSLS